MLIEGKQNKDLLQKIKKKLKAKLEFYEHLKNSFLWNLLVDRYKLKTQRKKNALAKLN